MSLLPKLCHFVHYCRNVRFVLDIHAVIYIIFSTLNCAKKHSNAAIAMPEYRSLKRKFEV